MYTHRGSHEAASGSASGDEGEAGWACEPVALLLLLLPELLPLLLRCSLSGTPSGAVPDAPGGRADREAGIDAAATGAWAVAVALLPSRLSARPLCGARSAREGQDPAAAAAAAATLSAAAAVRPTSDGGPLGGGGAAGDGRAPLLLLLLPPLLSLPLEVCRGAMVSERGRMRRSEG